MIVEGGVGGGGDGRDDAKGARSPSSGHGLRLRRGEDLGARVLFVTRRILLDLVS
jgi:hypothetical protein